MSKARSFFIVAAIALAGLGYWKFSAAPSNAAKPMSGPPPAPVTVAKAEAKSVPIRIRAVGNVQASATVAVKSRMDGEIIQVGFKEGQDVQTGDVLFILDQRQLQAQLRQAEASVARDRAQLDSTRAERDRQVELAKKDFSSRQQFERAQSNFVALEASIRASEAAAENIRVQLSYATIRAPMDGRAGALLTDKGNVVKANDVNSLVVINQIKPIHVAFGVPERYLPEIKRRLADNALPVEVTVAEDLSNPVRGAVVFVDNKVDATTATITLKAGFPNTDLALWPGQFARVTLFLGNEENSVVVPAQAVQVSQQGSMVYVVREDKGLDIRKVEVKRIVDGEAVIAKGVAAGETVVTEGHFRLTTVSKVVVKGEPGAAK
jgi:multidrug efflux system membrane fusion protein